MQVDESVRTYGRTVPLRSTVVYGGMPMDPQIKALRGGIEILVATPGRLLDLVGQRVANLGQVEILVLDEADRMLDMGFLPDIQRIIALLPPQPPEPHVLGDVLGRHPAPLGDDPARPGDGRGGAPQHDGRRHPPARLPGRPRPQGGAPRPPHPQGRLRQVLVFTRTKLAASRLASWLDRHGLDAVAIHSDRSQPERTRALEEFKTGEIRVLVATDVAARGLDIEDLPHVVNFELPWNPQDYVHRIGRTGRAGATGDAISLVCIDEADLLRGVQRLLREAIPWTVEEGFIPDRNAEPRPLRGGGDFAAGGTGGGSSHHHAPSEAGSPAGGRGPALESQADSAGTAAEASAGGALRQRVRPRSARLRARRRTIR